MFDFPNTPSNGQQVTAPNGAVYAWNGTSWAPVSIGLPAYAPLNAPVFTGDARAVTPAYGDNDTSIPTTAFVQSAVAPVANNTGRNLVMNGAFAVAQRGAGPWTTGGYTADRWYFGVGGSDTGTASIVTLADADRTSIGDESAQFALQDAFVGSSVANSMSFLQHAMENIRRLAGKTVTLSFWARATSGTPRIGLGYQQNFGSGGSPSTYTTTNIGQTTPLSATWARYSFTFTVLSIVGKTLGTTAGTDKMILDFWLSAPSGSPPWYAESGNLGQQSGTVQLYGIQLEIGSVMTPFDAGGTPADQLRQCQRFYQTGTSQAQFISAQASTTETRIYPFVVQMRAAPTLTPTWVAQVNATGSMSAVGGYGFQFNANVTAGAGNGVNVYANWTASADL